MTPHIISAESCPSGFASTHKPPQMKNVRMKPSNNATKTAASISSILEYVFDTGVISVIIVCGRHLCRLPYLFLKELWKKEARVSQFIAYPVIKALALPTIRR